MSFIKPQEIFELTKSSSLHDAIDSICEYVNARVEPLEEQIDKWKSEYATACKFANDYEAGYEKLREVLKFIRKCDPHPDLSAEKYYVAFERIREKLDEML